MSLLVFEMIAENREALGKKRDLDVIWKTVYAVCADHKAAQYNKKYYEEYDPACEIMAQREASSQSTRQNLGSNRMRHSDTIGGAT